MDTRMGIRWLAALEGGGPRGAGAIGFDISLSDVPEEP